MKTGSPLIVGLLISFAALAKGAHDIWAATLVYVFVLGFWVFHLVKSSWAPQAPGWNLVLGFPLLGLLGIFFLSYRLSVNPSESFLSGWIGLPPRFFLLLACRFF